MSASDEHDAWHDDRDEARTSTRHAPEDPPPHDYDPAADGWIADWFGGKHD